jgi:SAM-dependent methyltransferase
MASAYTARSFEILRCGSCGLGRTALPDDFDLEAYYSRDYFQGGVDDGYADYTGSEETLRSEFRKTINHLLKFNPPRRQLLEFGCAYGFFLTEASTRFEKVTGIELCEDAVNFCHDRGLDVHRGVVEPATLPASIDVAVGLDVIEHIPEPHETVRFIADRMRSGGVLLMTTGDWASFLAGAMGPKWRLMTPPQHLSFFTPKSMRMMVENTGLRVVELSHPWKLVPLDLIAFQLRRILGLKPKVSTFGSLGIPVNLWDAMRVVAVKP